MDPPQINQSLFLDFEHQISAAILSRDRSQITKTILKLTLEIIYLLTGEDYMIVKKYVERISQSTSPLEMEGAQSFGMAPPLRPPIHEKKNDKKILELTKAIIWLLMGEEWEYFERNDLYKDAIVDNQQFSDSLGDARLNSNASNSIREPDVYDRPINPETNCQSMLKEREIHYKATIKEESTLSGEINLSGPDVYEEHGRTEYAVTDIEEELDLYAEGKMTCTGALSDPDTIQAEHMPILDEEHDSYRGGNLPGMEMDARREYIPVQVKEEISWEHTTSEEGNRTVIDIHTLAGGSQVDYVPSDDQGAGATNIDEQTVNLTPPGILCYKCGKVLSESDYSIHQETQCTEGTYNDTDGPSDDLQNQTDHKGGNLTCAEYEIGFPSRFLTDQAVHPSKKLFSCSVCGKYFTSSFSLSTHQRIHTGQKPYICAECGKRFNTRSNLASHQRTHTGEKPYSCSECGKNYTSRSNLVIHQRIHTGEKPFPCLECGRSFTCGSHLLSHQKSHTR